jgi:hypothetical protein
VRYTLNIQPVVPITLNANWKRHLANHSAVIYQDDVIPFQGDQFGLGDTLQSFFLSPEKKGPFGLNRGVGPALFFPTATDTYFKSEKWGAGRPSSGCCRKDSGLSES